MTAKPVSLKKNFIMNVILMMSSMIFPLVSFPYVARVIGPEGTGSVTFAISFVLYFDLFAQLGIPSYGIRECAKVRDDIKELSRVVVELLIINLIMTAVVYSLLFAVIWFVPALRDDKALYITCSALILLNSFGMNWLFQGLEKYTYITIRSLIFKVIALAGMFLLIKSRDDGVKYAGLIVFAGYASNVLNLVYVRKLINFRDIGKLCLRRHLKPIGVFFASSCATTIYLNLDNIMLGVMKSKTEVGYYGAAVKVKNILVQTVTALGAVLLPRLSYYVEHKRTEEFKAIGAKALHFVIVLASSLTIYFIIFAKPVILLISGEEYMNSIVPMQIIMPTLILIGLTNILGIQILVPLGMEKYVLISEVWGAIVDVILNAVFIPYFGAAGAALGTLAAEITVLIVQFIYLKKMGHLPSTDAKIWRIIASVLISALLASGTYLFGFMDKMRLFPGCFLTILVSGVIYFGVYALILIVQGDSVALEIRSTVIGKFKSILKIKTKQ